MSNLLRIFLLMMIGILMVTSFGCSAFSEQARKEHAAKRKAYWEKDKTCSDAFNKQHGVLLTAQPSDPLTTALVFVSTFPLATTTCVTYAIADNDVDTYNYVVFNYDNLTGQMAQGGGDHMDAISSLMECPEGTRSHFAQTAQARFPELQSGTRPYALALFRNLKHLIATDPILARQCRNA